MFYKKYLFGKTAVYYVETPVEGHEGKTTVGLYVCPAESTAPVPATLDCLMQVSLSGDEALIDYTNGVTMRNRSSTLLSVEKQVADERGVITDLTDGRGNFYRHTLEYYPETRTFSVQTAYENRTPAPVTLEMLSSFSLSGLAPQAENTPYTLHRMTSAWSRECRLQSLPFCELGLDMSWARYGVKCERWGQVGSMPNRGYYPFAAVEGDFCVGVTLEAPYSWQLELYKEKETCSLSGGLADYAFGHWKKTVPAGGRFETHRAFFAVGKNLLDVCNALVHAADCRLRVPASEEDMPVLFNEYCTTWGNPCAENIRSILAALADFPISYFVIDCGWCKPLDKGWCNAIGDWDENREMFPEGLPALVREINAAGKKAGIWFEYEVSGRDSEIFYDEDMHLRRDGSVITSKNRRFLDLRKPQVREYFENKVLGLLRACAFDYIKIDYNDAYDWCDGAESEGEGGRQVAEESLSYLDTLKNALPELVIENCASGGSRIEPLRMSKVSMCSFSDAHECAEIPLVAANVSRVVPARQMQIWVVLREGEDDIRTVYSLCSAMFGRICLSGDVLGLTKSKKTLVKEGLFFYNKVKDIVRYGDIVHIGCDVAYYRDPLGGQIYIKEYRGRRLILIHRLKGNAPMSVPLEGYEIKEVYTKSPYTCRDGLLLFGGDAYCAGAFLTEKKHES